MLTVCVVGLGQIGGSVAAALTRRKLARVVGVTRRAETARRARRLGLLAEAGTDLDAVRGADVAILATPVRTLLRQIPDVVARAGPGTLLTDVGSTKLDVFRAFRAAKPASPVLCGHPMAGNEKAGLDGVDPDLFEGRPWTLIPCRGTSRAFRAFEGLVKGMGARPVWMADARDHDDKVARISHVPYLLAYALMGTEEDALRVAGSSFRDATRVAQSDPDMVLDFLLTNRGPIARSAGRLAGRLRALVGRIRRGDAEGLRAAFRAARERRGRL
jgi:prephenate dehydrogenase